MLTPQQRSAILDKEINHYARDGWRVVSRTDTTAQLTKPRSWSCFWLLLFWFIYIFLRKKENGLYIEVGPNGGVKKIRS